MNTVVCDEDKLWSRVQEEVQASLSGVTGGPAKVKKKKGLKDSIGFLGTHDDGFLARLNACLSLQKQYRDMMRSLRDGLGGSHSLSQVTSMTPNALQSNITATIRRSVAVNSTSNLMSPTYGVSSVRTSFSQSKAS